MNGRNDKPSEAREDDFAELLKSAGRGPRLSDEARIRIRGNVEAAWKAAVPPKSAARTSGTPRMRRSSGGAEPFSQPRSARRRHPRRRWLLPATAAVFAGLLAVMVMREPNETNPGSTVAFAQVAAIDGSASVARDGQVTQIVAGEPSRVLLGDRIATSANGRLALRLPVGAELRLNTDTIVEITSAQTVRLVAGMVYFDTPPAVQQSDFEVQTDFGIVAHVGTQYTAGIDAAGLVVRVREGEAVVRDIGSDSSAVPVLAGSGEQLQIDLGGSVTRSDHAVDHPDWAWVQELARVPFDGSQSVLSLLEWAARSTGREVRFESEVTRNLARSVMLNQASGLSPAELLGAISSTTDFDVVSGATTLDVTIR